MGIVTEIQEYRGKTIIQVDGSTFARIPSRHFKKYLVAVGDPIDPDAYLKALADIQAHDAYDAALYRLERSAKTEHDMRLSLQRAGYVPEAIERTVSRLIHAGLLNDEEYAQRFVETQSYRAIGRHQLKLQLRKKGIDPETAERALSQIDDEHQLAAARDWMRKLAPRYAAQESDPRMARRKLSQALARRGFSWDVISSAIDLDEDYENYTE